MDKIPSRFAFGRTVAAVVVACLVWFGAGGLGWADMRVVEETDGMRTETLYSNNRIVTPMPDGSKTMLFCDVGEIVIVSPSNAGRFWRGTFDDMRSAIEELFSFDEIGGDDGMGNLGALFGALFGDDDDDGETSVRVTLAGTETIAGYEAQHYVVETGNDDNWRVYEELWMSSALLGDVAKEAALCVDMMFEVQGQLMPAMATGFNELDEVMQSPEYQGLWNRGFPVRRKDFISFFGMSFETITEVVEVSHEPISDDVFTVPSGYTRVDHPLEIMMFDDM